MKYLKIIDEWCKLRHWDPDVKQAALRVYEDCSPQERVLMLTEFTEYIKGVKNGTIIPSIPQIPIRKVKRNIKDSKTHKFLEDYYNGK